MIFYTRSDPRFFDRRLYKGGGAGTSNESNPTTTNTDQRIAVQDGVGVSGSGNTLTVQGIDSDAVKALTQMGTDTIRSAGEAVVQLNEHAGSTTAASWDKTVEAGAALVDKLIDQSTTIGSAAISSFKPVENSNADIGKWAMAAAGAVALAVILNQQAKS